MKADSRKTQPHQNKNLKEEAEDKTKKAKVYLLVPVSACCDYKKA